jgi:hypothetical protein
MAEFALFTTACAHDDHLVQEQERACVAHAHCSDEGVWKAHVLSSRGRHSTNDPSDVSEGRLSLSSHNGVNPGKPHNVKIRQLTYDERRDTIS